VIDETSIKFQGDMKIKRKQQKQVIKHCMQMLIDAERKAERDSIGKIEAYKKIEKHVYRRIEREREATAERPIPEHDKMEAELDAKILDLQSELLEIEMKLQDALGASRKTFISRIKQIIGEMEILNADYNNTVLNEVMGFNEKFREAALIEQEKFATQLKKAEALGEAEVDALIEETKENNGSEYLDMMITFGDQETLIAALDSFKEIVETKVQSYESLVNNGIRNDWNAYEANMTESQHTRNREIIQEIVENTKKF